MRRFARRLISSVSGPRSPVSSMHGGPASKLVINRRTEPFVRARRNSLEVEPQRELNLASGVVRCGGEVLRTVASARGHRSLVVKQIEDVHVEAEINPLSDGKDLEQRSVVDKVERS